MGPLNFWPLIPGQMGTERSAWITASFNICFQKRKWISTLTIDYSSMDDSYPHISKAYIYILHNNNNRAGAKSDGGGYCFGNDDGETEEGRHRIWPSCCSAFIFPCTHTSTAICTKLYLDVRADCRFRFCRRRLLIFYCFHVFDNFSQLMLFSTIIYMYAMRNMHS